MKKNQKKGNNKSSPELRPRRRASQTYFFKYQLARNPLKAEEEDLKLALLASLQQCGNSTSTSSTTSDSQQHDDSQQHINQLELQQQQQQQQLPQTILNNQQLHEDQRSTPSSKGCDEDYLKKYRPETEDFLTFICFRITADSNNMKFSDKISNDSHNHLKRSSSPQKLNNNNNNTNSSPSNRRRPTRQSPRLASSNRKISENDSSNLTSNTAYDNSINYEEDMKRASIALEDMAQEINSADDIHNEIAQNSSVSVSKLSKNNKHLVKGLMTREFAGAFADEKIIFERISNHKL